MSNILALDTTGSACSVALTLNGVIYDDMVLAERQHTQRLLPMVDHILQQADVRLSELDAIAFGCGPGSFTGLRIACGVTQGLAFGANLPVIPVSSLATIAAQAFEKKPKIEYCLAAFDARMNQVYAGVYKNQDIPVLLEQEYVIEPELLLIPEEVKTLYAAGSGLQLKDRINALNTIELDGIDATMEVNAKFMLKPAQNAFDKGRSICASDAEPKYLRQQVSWKKQS